MEVPLYAHQQSVYYRQKSIITVRHQHGHHAFPSSKALCKTSTCKKNSADAMVLKRT